MHLGTAEIIVVIVLLVVLYGKRLPETMRIIGRGINTFKKSINEIKEEVHQEIDNDLKLSSNVKPKHKSDSISESRTTGLNENQSETPIDNKHNLAG